MPGHSYKGSAVKPAGPFQIPAPILSVDGAGVVTIVWPGTDPDQWGVYDPTDVSFGDEEDFFAGNMRSQDLSFLTGNTICVCGVNFGDNVFQTQPSNAVTIP